MFSPDESKQSSSLNHKIKNIMTFLSLKYNDAHKPVKISIFMLYRKNYPGYLCYYTAYD